MPGSRARYCYGRHHCGGVLEAQRGRWREEGLCGRAERRGCSGGVAYDCACVLGDQASLILLVPLTLFDNRSPNL